MVIAPEPLLLTRRLVPGPGPAVPPPLALPLTAEERQRLRGRRRSRCGRELLLQLPRGEALMDGEWLAPEAGAERVRVEAADEALLVVRAEDPLALLRAAYHLGNRHVALEIRPGELRLPEDPVLEALLERLGLPLERRREPFLPEVGAYDSHQHHSHPGAGDAAAAGGRA